MVLAFHHFAIAFYPHFWPKSLCLRATKTAETNFGVPFVLRFFLQTLKWPRFLFTCQQKM